MEFLIVILLILLNGVFSMSEIAIISSRKSKLKLEAQQGNKSAKTALDLAEEPDRFLSTIQIGITLIGILTGVYSGDALAGHFAPVLEKLGMSAGVAYTVAKVTIVIVVTYLTLILGELVPKRIGMSSSEKVAKIIARPMNILSKIASPFVWILSKSTALLVKLFRIKSSENKVTEEEIKSIIQEGTEDGEIQTIEQDIVERVFTLGDRKLDSIMTYRNDIVWIDINMSIEEIKQLICNNLYETYPVAENSLDNVLGIVHLKDLFCKIDQPGFKIKDAVCAPVFFHENMDVYKALEQMKQKQAHHALVFDEYGNLQGVVTFRDILEALVGEIPDGTEESSIVQREDGSWLIDAQSSFYDFLEYFDMEELYSENDFNTLSGLILDELEHIPVTGEKIEWGPFVFEVVDMDGARIDKILVARSDN